MKQFLLCALLCVLMMLIAAPFVLAQATTPDEKTVGLLWLSATSIAQFIVGFLIKKVPDLPNQTIPYITAVVGTIGFVVLLGMSFKEAVLLAMATAHAATMAYEGGSGVKGAVDGGGQ